MFSLITSLVVPAISVTIALSKFNKALNKEDFPTFGRPTIATLTPCLKISEDLAQSKILSISLIECLNLSTKYEYSGSATSSGKSIPATILDAVSKISPFISFILFAKTPDKFLAD